MESQSSIVVATPKQATSTLLQQANAILELKRQFKADVHYGPPYPGSKKHTLLKPGAEILSRRFGIYPHYEEMEKILQINPSNLSESVILYVYRCQMIDIATGAIVGEAIGACSSLEDKYRQRKAGRICPECDKESIRRSSYPENIPAEKRGWYCKDCKAKFAADAQVIIGQAEGVTINPNPLNELNTIIKISQKRAMVSAVLVATGASAYFSPGDTEVKDLYDVAPLDDDSDMIDEVLDEGTTSSFPPDIQVEKVSGDAPPSGDELPAWPTAESIGTLIRLSKEKLSLQESEIKRLLGLQNLEDVEEWSKFKTRAEAAQTLKDKLENELAKTPPAQPKNPPPVSEWTAEDLATAETLWMDYDLKDNAAALALVGAKAWSEFKMLNVAREKLHMQCIARKVPMIAYGAKYVKTAKATYVEFTTPTAIRLYGRDDLRDLGSEWFLYAESWLPGKTYDFAQDMMGALKVVWEKKNNYFQATAVTVYSSTPEPVQ